MITKTSTGITLVAALCFGGTFLGTVAVRSQTVATPEPVSQSPIAKQLQLDAEQAKVVEAHDPSFVDDLRTLRANLQEARSRLAAAFEDENVTDDEIRQCVEATIEAHNQLERRVAEYLIAVRAHLTPKQQRQLYGFCAEKVREGGKRWRHGWGRRGDTSDGGCEPENGRGTGRGQGHGPGGRHGQGQAHDPGTERGDCSRDDG